MDWGPMDATRIEDMCRSREKIIKDSFLLSSMKTEIEAMEKRIHENPANGDKKIDLYKHKLEFENYIRTEQNTDDIKFMVNWVVNQAIDRITRPSITQLFDRPRVLWPLFVGSVFLIWVIAGIESGLIISWIESLGYTVDSSYLTGTALMAVVVLYFVGFKNNREVVQKEIQEIRKKVNDYMEVKKE